MGGGGCLGPIILGGHGALDFYLIFARFFNDVIEKTMKAYEQLTNARAQGGQAHTILHIPC